MFTDISLEKSLKMLELKQILRNKMLLSYFFALFKPYYID